MSLDSFMKGSEQDELDGEPSLRELLLARLPCPWEWLHLETLWHVRALFLQAFPIEWDRMSCVGSSLIFI